MSPLTFEELKSLVLLNRLAVGCGREARAFLGQGVLPSVVIQKIQSEHFQGKAEALQRLLQTFDPEKEIETAERTGVRLLTLWDEEYPSLLKQIPDPPFLLYVRGSLLETDEAALAIVGSRHPSFYGLAQTKKLSRELAESGLTVVSGLARGIDQTAHEAALSISFGRSIAVLGCGIDRVYPPENRKTYEALAEKGAILSEYALGTPPLAENFPRRNRIISGLSLGVLVVEAHSRSGSLITAHEALDQGREVFAVPGPIDQLTSRGTHRLLKEGACLVETTQDILEVLGPSLWPLISRQTAPSDTPAVSSQPLSSNEQKVIELLQHRTLAYDEMTRELGLSTGPAASLLLHLELKKKIRKTPNGRFTLVA